MNNGINGYNPGRLNAYQQLQRTTEVQRPQAPQTVREVQQAQAARASAPTQGLSQDEQQMIDRYFPAEPALTMRLYGPGRGTQTVNPQAVGSRLDLRG